MGRSQQTKRKPKEQKLKERLERQAKKAKLDEVTNESNNPVESSKEKEELEPKIISDTDKDGDKLTVKQKKDKKDEKSESKKEVEPEKQEKPKKGK